MNAPPFPDTFKISNDGRSIECLHCHWISYHPTDVLERYCAHCHVFHEDIWPPIRQAWINKPENTLLDLHIKALEHACKDCLKKNNDPPQTLH